MYFTPAYGVTRDDECLPGVEGVHHDGVEVEPLTEHPEEVTHREILAQHVQHPAPQLQNREEYNM